MTDAYERLLGNFVKRSDNRTMATSPYRSWVEISREQIAANFRAVKRVVGEDIEVMPVVKADAYRHGAVEVSRALIDRGRALARRQQRRRRRRAAAGRNGDSHSRDGRLSCRSGRVAMLEHELTPVIHSLDDLHALDQLARDRRDSDSFIT